jgi:hypothetical protein
MHLLKKGLLFEINQGGYTSGSNVRDAACYLAWAFARSYDSEVLGPYVTDLSTNLLLTALFDKEVGCRRAASAAFQENVGRQGNFPHGIDIITEADYFTLAIRNNAYMKIGLFVAHYKEYFEAFVDHLSEVKLFHSDIEIRKLSAATLSVFVPHRPEYFISNV